MDRRGHSHAIYLHQRQSYQLNRLIERKKSRGHSVQEKYGQVENQKKIVAQKVKRALINKQIKGLPVFTLKKDQE